MRIVLIFLLWRLSMFLLIRVCNSLREKIPLQNFTSKVNLIKGVWNIKVTFVLTLLSVKMQIWYLQYQNELKYYLSYLQNSKVNFVHLSYTRKGVNLLLQWKAGILIYFSIHTMCIRYLFDFETLKTLI